MKRLSLHRFVSSRLLAPAVLLGLLLGGVLVPTALIQDAPPKNVSDVVLERTRSQPMELVDLIVSYDSRPAHAERSRILALGGKIGRQFKAIDAISVKLPADAGEELAGEPSGAWISLDAPIQVAAKGSGGGNSGSGNDVSQSDFTGAGVNIAVLDSGLYEEHTDFWGQVLTSVNFVTSNSSNNNGNSSRAQDTWGHGTHVSGLIAGTGQASQGASMLALHLAPTCSTSGCWRGMARACAPR